MDHVNPNPHPDPKPQLNPNPYAPPEDRAERTERTDWADLVERSGLSGDSVRFAGRVGERDLRSYLRADGHVGFSVSLLLILWSVLSISLVALFLDGGFIGIAAGILGIVAIAVIVSTIPYRSRVFKTANPRWTDPIRGSLETDGIYIDRPDARVFLRWDWFGDAVRGEDWVALVPATQPMQPIIITATMLEHPEHWPRVLDIATGIQDNLGANQQHRQRNLRLIQDIDRERTIEVPADAIPIQGTIRVEDFQRLPKPLRRRIKPVRSIVVITGLFLSGACIVAGLSSIFFEHVALLPGFLAFYGGLVVIGLAWRRRRPGFIDRRVVYAFNGYATESLLVSDFAVTATQIPWSELRLLMQSDELIALRRRQWQQTVLIRRDMVDDDRQWHRLCSWIEPLP